MLRNPKKPALMLAQPSHVDVFVEHYDQLRRWAVQFSDGDTGAAEDLLHDTFIAFTLNRQDINSIQNLDGYLFVVMRNLHHSQVRRATRMPVRSFSVVEYDTAEMPFWSCDPRDHLRMRDELWAVCRFACIRKETSKSGSLLILRFFHGYYPDEIALIMGTVRATINVRLKQVRAEVRVYLEEPERLAFIDSHTVPAVVQGTNYSPDRDLRIDLRKQIFDSRQGECLTKDQLSRAYELTNDGPSRHMLAHIVSCPKCIETMNTMLGLPSLSSRYPTDSLGNDPSNRGGSGGGGGAEGGGKMLDSFISRRDAHFYHEPRELCISVNGQFQSLQKIVAGKGEFTLSLDTNENLGFIEVFSELGVRLLILNVEPFPEGESKQSAQVELSFGRTIEANLNYSGAFPALQVTYNDPMLEVEETAVDISNAPDLIAVDGGKRTIRDIDALPSLEAKGRSFFDIFKSFLQPARITTAFAALLVAVLLIYRFAPTTVTATELLNRSAANETALIANSDRVLHRTLDLEEVRNGEIVSRHKVDIWQSTGRDVTARRLYDDRGQLVMGDWRNASGVQTIYQPGHAAKLQPVPQTGRSIGFEDAWQLSVSAAEFKMLIRVGDEAQLQNRGGDYLISYERPTDLSVPPAVAGGAVLLRASITLSKEDLRAIEQTFTLKIGDETREYRMTEAAYEWRPANSVAPAVFEPNVELIDGKPFPNVGPGNAPRDSTNTNTNRDSSNSNTSAPAAIATAALEVEIVEALNNANAFMGEPVNVSRTGDGKISVTAMVDTPARKQALLAALNNFRQNSAVRLQIETVEEAQARINRQSSSGRTSSPSITMENIAITQGQNPVLAELRKRLSEDETRNLSNRVTSRARSLRQHALAAKQIAERFSAADLQSLTPAERVRWVALIRGHAEKFLSEMDALRRDLGPYFPEATAGTAAGGSTTSDREIQSQVRELFQFASTLKSGLDRSFSANAEGAAALPVKTSGFWSAFSSAGRTARSLASAK